jgi:tRNA G18 (ribose-2'-O)-methylase SpoU
VSLGAEEFVEWEQRDFVVELIEELKKKGFEICALEQTKKAEDLFEATFEKNVVLVVGNEVEGVEEETLRHCDRHLEIPMHGKKASLNVSIATGIAMYEIGRKS